VDAPRSGLLGTVVVTDFDLASGRSRAKQVPTPGSVLSRGKPAQIGFGQHAAGVTCRQLPATYLLVSWPCSGIISTHDARHSAAGNGAAK